MSKLATKVIQKALSVRETEDEVSRLRSDRPGSAKSRKGSRVEGLDEISERLADRLDTRVEISLTKTKGKIVIEFATVSDLNRILGELGESSFQA
jgi:ParB family chromosome partitioning protein